MTPATADILNRVRNRFSGDGYHVLREVRFDRTNCEYIGGRTRRADVVAVGLERRTQHAIHGVEIKVTRADWMQELRDATKAADAARYCHFWWIAAADKSIVRDGELPDGWGLLVPRGRHLVAMVKPTRREPVVDHRFMASLVQSASTQHGYCRAWARMGAYTKGLEQGRKSVENYWRRWAYEEASGR